MFEGNGFTVRKVTKEQLRDPETKDRFQKLYNHVNSERSRVIDSALKIENTLTIVILHTIVGKDYSRHRLLRTLVFEAESCSFMQLRKMLSLIFELFRDKIDVLTDSESKVLRRNLNDIITFRNMFAHGQIVIDAPTNDVLITHYQGGPKETVVTVELIDEYIVKCIEVDTSLKTLNDYFKVNRIEY